MTKNSFVVEVTFKSILQKPLFFFKQKIKKTNYERLSFKTPLKIQFLWPNTRHKKCSKITLLLCIYPNIWHTIHG